MQGMKTTSKRNGTKGRFQIHRVESSGIFFAGWTGNTAYTRASAEKMAQRLSKIYGAAFMVVDTMPELG